MLKQDAISHEVGCTLSIYTLRCTICKSVSKILNLKPLKSTLLKQLKTSRSLFLICKVRSTIYKLRITIYKLREFTKCAQHMHAPSVCCVRENVPYKWPKRHSRTGIASRACIGSAWKDGSTNRSSIYLLSHAHPGRGYACSR